MNQSFNRFGFSYARSFLHCFVTTIFGLFSSFLTCHIWSCSYELKWIYPLKKTSMTYVILFQIRQNSFRQFVDLYFIWWCECECESERCSVHLLSLLQLIYSFTFCRFFFLCSLVFVLHVYTIFLDNFHSFLFACLMIINDCYGWCVTCFLFFFFSSFLLTYWHLYSIYVWIAFSWIIFFLFLCFVLVACIFISFICFVCSLFLSLSSTDGCCCCFFPSCLLLLFFSWFLCVWHCDFRVSCSLSVLFLLFAAVDMAPTISSLPLPCSVFMSEYIYVKIYLIYIYQPKMWISIVCIIYYILVPHSRATYINTNTRKMNGWFVCAVDGVWLTDCWRKNSINRSQSHTMNIYRKCITYTEIYMCFDNKHRNRFGIRHSDTGGWANLPAVIR